MKKRTGASALVLLSAIFVILPLNGCDNATASELTIELGKMARFTFLHAKRFVRATVDAIDAMERS